MPVQRGVTLAATVLARRVAAAAALAALLVACAPARTAAARPSGGESPSGSIATTRTTAPGVYEDPDGLFTMRFLARPEVDVKREPLGAGEIVTTTLSVASDARLTIAMKLVLSHVGAYDCAKGLTGMRDHTLANMGCAPTAERSVELRGHPGREVLFSCTRRPMRGAMAIYCDESALATSRRVTAYEVIAAYSEHAWDEAEARAVLSGFALR